MILFTSERDRLGLPLLAEGVDDDFRGVAPVNALPFNDAPLVPALVGEFSDARGGAAAAAQFDWRAEGLHMARVVDQKECGCCWAVASVGVISDRIALITGENPDLNPLELMLCVADGACSSACSSCSAETGLATIQDLGLRSGSSAACPSLGDWLAAADRATTASCSRISDCLGEAKRYFAEEGSVASLDDVQLIMKEIASNGPVVTTFQVFTDFVAASAPKNPMWKETAGVYVFHQPSLYGPGSNASLGWHCVALVGWGEEEMEIQFGTGARIVTVPYWIARNSWGDKWGDGGYFKIAKTNKELGNEQVGVDVGFTATSRKKNRTLHARLGGVVFARAMKP